MHVACSVCKAKVKHQMIQHHQSPRGWAAEKTFTPIQREIVLTLFFLALQKKTSKTSKICYMKRSQTIFTHISIKNVISEEMKGTLRVSLLIGQPNRTAREAREEGGSEKVTAPEQF